MTNSIKLRRNETERQALESGDASDMEFL